MERVLEILTDVRPDVDFMNETKLIDDGIIDSFDIIAIVSELNDEFDVQIPIDELEPDNFNTVEAIYELIIKLQEEDE
ncbi:MAG: phosphopantetheine-binding protein [Lachnospiraceae bacterium]|nr:phosphopantetheine-binding protein [Lachnospiraceae bacterium]